jgi:hypothetical protein
VALHPAPLALRERPHAWCLWRLWPRGKGCIFLGLKAPAWDRISPEAPASAIWNRVTIQLRLSSQAGHPRQIQIPKRTPKKRIVSTSGPKSAPMNAPICAVPPFSSRNHWPTTNPTEAPKQAPPAQKQQIPTSLAGLLSPIAAPRKTTLRVLSRAAQKKPSEPTNAAITTTTPIGVV